MIKTQYLTPEIYTKESRSFQLFGHLYDLVYNYSKMCIDTMENNPISKNTDYKLLDLMATTLGFETRHNYNVKDLFALCLSFNEILKYKGSKKAIDWACHVLLNARGITEDATVIVDKNSYTIYIFIPKEFTDTILLEDLFDYILPTGYTYQFKLVSETSIGETTITTTDRIEVGNYVSDIPNTNEKSIGTISKGMGEAIKIDDSFKGSSEGEGKTYTSIVSTPRQSTTTQTKSKTRKRSA